MSLLRSRRRPAALVAGVLLLAAPLSACGFNYSTDEVYLSASGVDYRGGQLDVLSAVVVSAQHGSGTFVASFSNNSTSASERILAMSAGAPSATETTPLNVAVNGFEPITLGPSGFVNLALDPSITVTGDFIAGHYVPLTFDLESGPDIVMSVPVVAATDQYEGLDISGAVVGIDEPTE